MKTTLDKFLKSRKIVGENQINEIQRVRSNEGGGWASHLVDSELLTESKLLKIIIQETGIPYIPLLGVTPHEELLNEFTFDFMKTFECFPIDKIGGILTIATPNPFQRELFTCRNSKDCQVMLYICSVSEWQVKIKLLNQNKADK